MKPRSAIQRQFVEWAGQLPPLDEWRLEWAKKLFPAEALYYSRRGNNCEFRCMCCGHIEKAHGKWLLKDYGLDNWTCPECGASCKVLPQYDSVRGYYGRSDVTSSRYVTLMEVRNGAQVFRTFDVLRHNGVDSYGTGIPTYFTAHEIYQNWILEDGREFITHRPYTRGYNHFSWDYKGAWGIGEHNHRATGYFEYDDVFELGGNWYFPRPRVLPLLRRNGFKVGVLAFANIDAAVFARRLIKEPMFEELMKCGLEQFAVYFCNHGDKIENYINSIRICVRNRYKIIDVRMWLDYVNNLRDLGLDDRNPHYICPASLVDAHRQALARLNRKIRKEKREALQKTIAQRDVPYQKRVEPYAGFTVKGFGVVISVLRSVKDIYEEGNALHHCVFLNEYDKHRSSLLLSAKDAKTMDRLETIEFSLTAGVVLQSRGLLNKNSAKHGEILRLMENSTDQILALRPAAARPSAGAA